MAGKKETPNYSELLGWLWLALGMLLFLSLISYSPTDLPFYTSNVTKNNFIGLVGAYSAYGLFFCLGIAAYVVPALLIYLAFSSFFFGPMSWRWKIVWSLAILVTASGLLHLTALGTNWAYETNVVSPGGFIGKTIDADFFVLLLNNLGAGIVLGVFYIISVICFFELHPRQMITDTYLFILDWNERRQLQRKKNASPLDRLTLEQKEMEKKQRELEKMLAKHSAQVSEPEEPTPAPRVIDTSAPRNEPPPPEQPEPEPPRPPKVKRTPPPPRPASVGKADREVNYEDYRLPSLDHLKLNSPEQRPVTNEAELKANADLLVRTLAQFGIAATPGDITKGATITRYELYPAEGVRVDKIVGLQRDIARTMRAERINILAPIPGKNTVGVEIANSSKVPIVLRDLFETSEWANSSAKIPIALGKDVYGHLLVADLAEMPHLLIAGTTGSGKSVCVNCIILSLLYRFRPDELRLILVDPKQVEMQVYNAIPHLVVPVVTDPKKVLLALRWVINEMEKRYQILAKIGVRNITSFNARVKNKSPKVEQLDLDAVLAQAGPGDEDEEEEVLPKMRVPRDDDIVIPDRLPYIVVIIDELADLMQTASADVETAISRLTAKARAAGIHLIVATQTPRREVITGVIKTNIPSRIAFQVPSSLDSRVILDENGAENLLGKGDLLYLPPGSARLVRGQGAFVSDEEVKAVVDFCGSQAEASFDAEIHQKISGGEGAAADMSFEDKDLIVKCWEVIRQEKRASTSMLQRRLRLGYNKAAWVIDFLERVGALGPENGAKPREIMVDLESYILPL